MLTLDQWDVGRRAPHHTPHPPARINKGACCRVLTCPRESETLIPHHLIPNPQGRAWEHGEWGWQSREQSSTVLRGGGGVPEIYQRQLCKVFLLADSNSRIFRESEHTSIVRNRESIRSLVCSVPNLMPARLRGYLMKKLRQNPTQEKWNIRMGNKKRTNMYVYLYTFSRYSGPCHTK